LISDIVLARGFELASSEAYMQVASSHSGWRRWIMPVLLGIILPLLFAALPGEPLQILARDASLVKQVRTEIATLHAVKTAFKQLQEADKDVASGQSSQLQTVTISGVRRALDRMPGNDIAGTLRNAFEAYAQALARAVPTARSTEPAMRPLLINAPTNSIDILLGHLQASDEARLQEPLLAMRLAAAALRMERDPQLAEQVSRWSGIIAAQLDRMAIPQGTRVKLLAGLAAYEHAVLGTQDALPRQPPDVARLQPAARAVQIALANADRALTAEQRRLINAFEVASSGFLWLLAAALGTSLLIVGFGAFGREAPARGVVRNWQAR
jgi:hypothetical protein